MFIFFFTKKQHYAITKRYFIFDYFKIQHFIFGLKLNQLKSNKHEFIAYKK